MEHETGESAQGELYLDRLVAALRQTNPATAFATTPLSITTIACITGIYHRSEIAEAVAEVVLSEQSVKPISAISFKGAMALMAVRKRDQSGAEEQYAYLLGQRGTMIFDLSSVDHLLGLLSQTMGNLDQAAAHFDEALAICRKAGYRPELAWTCCDYSVMLLERNAEDDRAQARSLLDESLAISSELGIRPLIERVLSRQEILKA